MSRRNQQGSASGERGNTLTSGAGMLIIGGSMKKEQVVVLDTSDEAAKITTVTGWLSRDGRFFGQDERTARYAGCTHVTCETCGTVRERNTYCSPCYHRKQDEKYAAMPRKEWDGVGMLYSQAADEFFHDEDQILDHCEESDCDPKDLKLIICEPQYAREIDPNEHYCNDLPEEGEVDSELADAFDELNKLIRESKPILSWYPGKFAASNFDDK
jgi:hypothetical protein